MSNPSSPEDEQRNAAPAESARGGISRRGFLKGAGLTAAGTALLEGVQGFTSEAAAEAPGGVRELGPEAAPVRLHVNGAEHTLEIEPRTTLAEALRIHLGMTGTKIVCDRGACGACTVHLDGRPVYSCMLLAADAVGHDITTIEGLPCPTPLQQAFVKRDAMMCGFCTPGFVMALTAHLKNTPHPTLEQVKAACAGNTCRCGTYPHIFEAAMEVG